MFKIILIGYDKTQNKNNLILNYNSSVQQIQKNINMQEIRSTGKFNMRYHKNQEKLITSSLICIPHYAGHQIRKIQWSRKYNDHIQRITNYDQLQQYQCSQLDKDFYIQAFIETQVSGNIEARMEIYGPIQLHPDYSFLLEGLKNDQIFEVQIIGNNKIFECLLNIMGSQIILKNKNPQSGNQHMIYLQDIIHTSIKRIDSNIQLLVFPTIYLRIVQLKLFQQLSTKYTTNNEPLTLRIVQPNFVLNHYNVKNNERMKNNLQWRRLLLKLNNIRIENIRRMSFQNIGDVISSKRQCKTEENKSQSQTDFSNLSTNNKTIQRQTQRSQNMEQQTPRTNSTKNISKQKQDSDLNTGKSAGNDKFLSQFQDLLFGKDQQQKEEKLDLELSFEELQKKSKPEKQKQMRLQILAKKKARTSEDKVKRLKYQLQQILFERRNLLQTLQKQKAEVEALQNGRSMTNQGTIDVLRSQLSQLKYEYQTLVEQTGQRRNSDRKFLIN